MLLVVSPVKAVLAKESLKVLSPILKVLKSYPKIYLS